MFARVWAIVFTLHQDLAMKLLLPFCDDGIAGGVDPFDHVTPWSKAADHRNPGNEEPVEPGGCDQICSVIRGDRAVGDTHQTVERRQGTLPRVVPVRVDRYGCNRTFADGHGQAGRGVVLELAAKGIIVGAIANTLFKAGFAVYAGASKLRVVIIIGMGSMILAGIGSWFVV